MRPPPSLSLTLTPSPPPPLPLTLSLPLTPPSPSLPQVRPPQPPVYFFVIDVSAASAQNNMLSYLCEAVKASLNELPGLPRTQFGLLTFDQAIHFYNLKVGRDCLTRALSDV